MRKNIVILILSIVAIIVAIGAGLHCTRMNKAQVPTVSSTVAQMGVVGDLLKRYKLMHGALPERIEDLRELAIKFDVLRALKYTDPTTRITSDWHYSKTLVRLSGGKSFLIICPNAYSAANSEMKGFGAVNHRIVLSADFDVQIINESEVLAQ